MMLRADTSANRRMFNRTRLLKKKKKKRNTIDQNWETKEKKDRSLTGEPGR